MNASATQRLAVLEIGELRLAVPQNDVRTLEAASDVDAAERARNACGWLHLAGERVPAYCIDETLHVLEQWPQRRRICAVLAGPRGAFGLLCDEFYPLILGRLPQDVPRAARTLGSPLRAVFEREGTLVCVSSAAGLAAFLAVSAPVAMEAA